MSGTDGHPAPDIIQYAKDEFEFDPHYNIVLDLCAEIERLRRVRDTASAFRRYLCKSVNVGPLTKDPTREAALLRNLYAALDEAKRPEAT